MEELGNEIKALEEIVVGEAEKVENGGNQKIQEREDEPLETEVDYEIEYNDSDGKFKTTFHVNQIFFQKIHGNESSTRIRLEKETKTEILVPDDGGGNIEIIGATRKNVIESRMKVEKEIRRGKSKAGLTHFVSIPCNVPEVIENFEKFKNDLLNDEELGEIDPNIFQNPKKLHQTIFPIILSNDVDMAMAINYLNQCKQEILDPFFDSHPGKLEVNLSGIGIMNDDPSKANVLYAEIKSEELQELCNQIMQFYIKKFMIPSEHKTVKLHVTLMNTVFLMRRSRSREPERKRQKKNLKFDATKILEKYKNYEFGKVTLEEIHLSNVSKVAENGFYEATALVKV